MGVDGGVVWCLIMTCGFELVLLCEPLFVSAFKRSVWPSEASVFPDRQETFLAHLPEERETNQISA